MNLQDWMMETRTGDADLAATLTEMGIPTDRSTISRIRRGKLVPSVNRMRGIHAITGGQVTANCFVHPTEYAA